MSDTFADGTAIRVVADISVSLDGFVTGPDVGPDNGLGTGGEALHLWAFSDDPEEKRMLSENTERSGVVMMGRTLFDWIDAPGGWSDEVGFGAGEAGKPPFVVVTSERPASVPLTGLDWTFATTGLQDAVATARERATARAAESEISRDVVIMGGGSIIGSAVSAGLVDTLSLHVAPVLLGSGTPLFSDQTARELVQRTCVATANAVHLTYDVR